MKKLNEKGSTLRGSKGFTLIELIVVIVVIGILAGLVIIRIGSASKDARNAKRKADLAQIRTAIEQYRAKGGTIDFGQAVALKCTTALLGTGTSFVLPDCETPITTTLEGAALLFQTNTTSIPYPSITLQGSVYPTDPQDSAKYYIISFENTNKTYTLKANSTVVYAPSNTDVPFVKS